MERLKSVLKSEFRMKQLGFSTIVHHRVFFSMWRIPPIAIILYKLMLATYVDFWLIETAVGYYYDSYDENSTDGWPVWVTNYSEDWPVWLTNWTYTLLALHLTLSTLAVIVYHRTRFHKSRAWLFSRSPAEHWRLMQDDVTGREITTESHSTGLDSSASQTDRVQLSSTPWYVIVLWILFDMSAASAPLITLIYFAALWPFISVWRALTMTDLQLHGINSVCMFIDLLLSPIPVRILHVIYPVIYGLIYIVFSVIYWAVGHRRALYPVVLDWNHAGQTIGIILVAILIFFVLHLLLFALHKLKVYIYLRLYSSDHSKSSRERDSDGFSGPYIQTESQSTLSSVSS